jgi:nicotinic acid phosphoribosyltransferase
MQITTNGQARDLISPFELDSAQYSKLRKEFDHLDDQDFDSTTFFKYKGQIYALADFLRIDSGDLMSLGWQGIASWYAGAGLVVKVVNSYTSIIVGTYTC